MAGVTPEAGSRTAWVVGATGGIGEQATYRLHEAGYRVAFSGRRSPELARVAERLTGDRHVGVEVDVASETSVRQALATVIDHFEGLDAVVFCAGTNVPRRSLTELSWTDWESVVDVNLSGAARVSLAALPHLRRAGSGSIVFISSWVARHPLAGSGAAYAASKKGIAGLVEAINFEHGRDGVRATAIQPGFVDTDFLGWRDDPPTEEQRRGMLTAADVADVVTYVVGAPPRVCISELLLVGVSDTSLG